MLFRSKVLVPIKNKKDILEMEPEVIDQVNIIFVENMKEVVKESILM